MEYSTTKDHYLCSHRFLFLKADLKLDAMLGFLVANAELSATHINLILTMKFIWKLSSPISFVLLQKCKLNILFPPTQQSHQDLQIFAKVKMFQFKFEQLKAQPNIHFGITCNPSKCSDSRYSKGEYLLEQAAEKSGLSIPWRLELLHKLLGFSSQQ